MSRVVDGEMSRSVRRREFDGILTKGAKGDLAPVAHDFRAVQVVKRGEAPDAGTLNARFEGKGPEIGPLETRRLPAGCDGDHRLRAGAYKPLRIQ